MISPYPLARCTDVPKTYSIPYNGGELMEDFEVLGASLLQFTMEVGKEIIKSRYSRVQRRRYVPITEG
jgi:hypothetical protein